MNNSIKLNQNKWRIPKRYWLKNLLTLTLIASFTFTINAATITFNNLTSTDWFTAANWDLGTIPTAADDVIIPAGFTVDINGSAVALSVLVDGTLDLDPGSDLSIDGTVGTALGINPTGTVNNNGDINIGLNTLIDGWAIANLGTLNNTGDIIIDAVFQVNRCAVRNTGTITNDGLMQIGSTAAFSFCNFNGGQWTNNGTMFSNIGSERALRNTTGSTMNNFGIINIPNSALLSLTGANFTNHPCAEVYATAVQNVPVSGLFGSVTNNGYFSLSATVTFSPTITPTAPWTNNGVVHSPNGNTGVAPINNGIIISDVALTENCGAFSPAFDLGATPNATITVYTDAAATNSAGVFDAATNTFTSMPPLAGGINNLFVKVEATGCADQIVPWELDVTSVPCCDLSTWTGAADDDWHNAMNWSPMYVPTTCNDVLIPAGTPTDPVISASAVALSVEVDGTLDLDPGSDLSIDGTVGTAITVNPTGTVNNDGDIFFGQTTMIDGRGIVNTGAFNNLSSGQLIFDQVGLIGGGNIRNANAGLFTNDGYIDMLNGSAPGFGFVIFNGSVINNGTIEIDRFADGDLRVATTLDNYGVINLVNANGGIKINAGAVFTNHPCAEYYSAWIGGNAGLFDNAGFVSLFSGTFGTVGNINNTGVIHTPAGVPSIATVTNSSIIISDVALTENCGAFSPAFDLGANPNATITVYTDAAGTNSAGTFDAATNTFTPTTMLPNGANTLYVKVEATGCADQIVSWELDATSSDDTPHLTGCAGKRFTQGPILYNNPSNANGIWNSCDNMICSGDEFSLSVAKDNNVATINWVLTIDQSNPNLVMPGYSVLYQTSNGAQYQGYGGGVVNTSSTIQCFDIDVEAINANCLTASSIIQLEICVYPEDVDGDGCADCSSGTYDPANDGTDTDGDGLCDVGDTDDDGDGVDDVNDSDPLDPFVCSDTDNDGCEDCQSGMYDPANDGPDADGDGICDASDNCINTANSSQADSDCDGVGDACDLCDGGDDSIDNDGDGLPDCAYPPSFSNIITAWKCGNNNKKVSICHVPSGNPANAHTICVSKNAVSAHVGNHGGDYLGPCNNSVCPTLRVQNTGEGMLLFNAIAELEKYSVDLNWITNIDNEVFIIEKSLDGTNFETIYEVQGMGEMTDTESFRNYDNNPIEGLNYYRLKVVTPDGLEIQSDVRMVLFTPAMMKFEVFPNPAEQQVFISMLELVGKSGKVQITNQVGQIFHQQSFDQIPGAPVRVDLSDYVGGVYFITVRADGRRQMTKKIVVINEN